MANVNWSYVYVVFRVEPEIFQASEADDISALITIKEVLPSEEQADAEVQRLNALNSAKGVRYFFQNARHYPDGRKANDSV